MSRLTEPAKVPAKRGRPAADKQVKKAPAKTTTKAAASANKKISQEMPIHAKEAMEEVASKPTLKRGRPKNNDTESKSANKRVKVGVKLNSAPNGKLNVYVVGDGESGELGLGPKPIDGRRPTGVKVPRRNKLLDELNITQVSAGGMHCVALTADQKIVTWGVNDSGALGRDTKWEAPTKDMDAGSDSEDSDDEADLSPPESTPTTIPGATLPSEHTFVQVVATDSASFALTSTGDVYGWGSFRGNDGPLGFFTEDAAQFPKSKDPEKQMQRTPVHIPYLTKIKSLAAGNNHVVALDIQGRVHAWGAGQQNQLGRRILEGRLRFNSLTPARLGISKITQIACGAFHNFAINDKGLVYSWGLNNFGQTGIPDGAGEGDAVVEKPTIVEALRPYKIRAIQGGEHHSVACTEDGKLLIWGRCDEGQAGVSLDTVDKDDLVYNSRELPKILAVPTVVPTLSDVVFVAAAIDNSFAITKEGKAYAWGYSENYRTGLATEDTVKIPTLLERGDMKGKNINFAACGGQFSILAGFSED